MALLTRKVDWIYPEGCYSLAIPCKQDLADFSSIYIAYSTPEDPTNILFDVTSTDLSTFAGTLTNVGFRLDISLGQGALPDPLPALTQDLLISVVVTFGDCSCVGAFKACWKPLCYFNRDLDAFIFCDDGSELLCDDGCPLLCS